MQYVLKFEKYDENLDLNTVEELPPGVSRFRLLNESLFHSGGYKLPRSGNDQRPTQVRKRNASLMSRFRIASLPWGNGQDGKIARKPKPGGVELVVDGEDFEHLKLCMENSPWTTNADIAVEDVMQFLRDAESEPTEPRV